MIRFCRHFFSHNRFSFVYLLLSLFSCSAFSAPATFSFVEFNIAFILGLSLTLLVIIALITPNKLITWRFPASLTVNLLAIFYAVAYLTTNQIIVLMPLAMLFLCLLFYWPLLSYAKKEGKLFIITHIVVGTCAVLYLGVLWYIPNIDAYTLWGAVSVLIMILAAVHIQQAFSYAKGFAGRLIVQWLITACFIVTLYLWVNSKLNVNFLVISAVACYLIAMVNGCWLVVQVLSSKIENKSNTAIVPIIAYPNDPATNLPTYQQALNNIESALKVSNDLRYVVIVFKPINFQPGQRIAITDNVSGE